MTKNDLLKPFKWVAYLMKGLTHNADGTFSSTKFFQMVGYVAATYVIVVMANSGKLSSEVFLIYVGSITAARSFQNYLSAKRPPEQNGQAGPHS